MTRQELIEKLISEKTLQTPRIIAAFKAVDRKDFVLPGYQDKAYEDYPLPIGFSATISQPTTVAFMLEKLEPRLGDKVFEIGAGSGYQTALLSYLVGKKGKIFSVEYVPELKKFAKNNLVRYNFSAKGAAPAGGQGSAAGGKNIQLFTGDGKIGLKKFAPFDRIISSASGNEIPKAWENQLRIRGRIVAPVADDLVILEKISKRKFKEERYHGFLFVPLR